MRQPGWEMGLIRMDTCIHMAESLWCSPETTTTFLISHTPKQNKKFKVTKKPQHVVVQLLSHVQLFETLWTVAHQALLSMGFSRQEYWSGLPFPPPEELPDPGFEPSSPVFYSQSKFLMLSCLHLYVSLKHWHIIRRNSKLKTC